MSNEFKPDNDAEQLQVKILDKTFSVRCPKEEVEELKRCATFLNEKIHELHGRDVTVGFERTVAITALNLCYELLGKEKSAIETQATNQQLQEQVKALEEKIELALLPNEQLEF